MSFLTFRHHLFEEMFQLTSGYKLKVRLMLSFAFVRSVKHVALVCNSLVLERLVQRLNSFDSFGFRTFALAHLEDTVLQRLKV